MIDAEMPVLAPASIQEVLDYGLIGLELSRDSARHARVKLGLDVRELALEDFADEWLTKAMFGYRWLAEVDQVQMSRWLAFDNLKPDYLALNPNGKKDLAALRRLVESVTATPGPGPGDAATPAHAAKSSML